MQDHFQRCYRTIPDAILGITKRLGATHELASTESIVLARRNSATHGANFLFDPLSLSLQERMLTSSVPASHSSHEPHRPRSNRPFLPLFLQVAPEEQKAIIAGFDDPSGLQAGGVRANGKKFFTLGVTPKTIYGKQGVSLPPSPHSSLFVPFA